MGIDPDDVLDVIYAIDEPIFTAPEIADRLDVTRKTISSKLESLQYAGVVERKDVGANAVAWWLAGTRKPRRDAEPRERALAPDQAGLDDVVDDVQEEDKDVRDIVDELDIPGSGDRLEARRQAIVDCHTHLRMEQTADKSDFLQVIERFDHGYANGESFWANVVKGKDTLQSLPNVNPPAPGGATTWRWTTEEN